MVKNTKPFYKSYLSVLINSVKMGTCPQKITFLVTFCLCKHAGLVFGDALREN